MDTRSKTIKNLIVIGLIVLAFLIAGFLRWATEHDHSCYGEQGTYECFNW